MAAFLHFDKILQVPRIIAHETCGLSYRRLVEAFLDADSEKWPLVGEIGDFFEAFARKLQRAGSEYIFSREWLDIYWPADEYMFIKMTVEGRIAEF